ncbi:MAG: T9SS type A sorting domain-containing protein [Chitinophagales bacterium]|nr:T9SS type A sorting domain-containing protein [Chitinophagales bacterium]MDW8419146.1 T9SS type A sorting domain-containing protein [Chitinophagales bacterium]
MKRCLLLFSVLYITACLTAQTPTWSSDVARIIYKHCTPCHHPGGIAPTSFMTYQEAAMYKFNINFAVSNGVMPPWMANPNYKHYAFERVLTNAEKQAIQQWVAAGAPAGDLSTAPAPPVYNNSTKLGTVDLSLTFPTFTVPHNGDVYRNFVVNTGLTQAKYITAIEIIPGNPEIVHHVLLFIDSSNNTINPNNPGGTGSAASKLIYGYVPGAQPYFTPPGTGFRLPPNARVVFQMHYAPGSAGKTDATTVNFKLTSTPQREISVQAALNHITSLTNGPLNIPANTTKTFYGQTNVPIKVTALAAWPHMHLIGRSITSFATTPTPGDTIRFVDIPSWNFHWQDNYIFPRTVVIPAGSVLRMRAYYDNTTNNPFNPNNPPQNVTAGEGTGDEMMMVFFTYLPYQNGDENLIIDKRILPRSGTTFCNGQSVLLETISGDGYSYQWYRDGQPITGANTFAFIATQAGQYTVKITLGNNSVTSDPVTVTVTAPPQAIITPQANVTICNGSSVTLQANTGQGLTYQWFRNDTIIPGATNSSYMAQVPGNYTVQVSNGCAATSAPVSVTVNSVQAAITASGPVQFCEGGQVTLSATGGDSYVWSNGASTSQINVLQSGTYTVTVSQNGCSATASQEVSVYPLPNAPQVSFNGSLLSSTPANYYNWLLNGAPLGINTQAFAPAMSGCYSVEITDANGCKATSDSICIEIVSINTPFNEQIKIYPIPAQTHLYLETNFVMLHYNYRITDLTGKLLKYATINGTEGSVDVSRLLSGAYVLHLYDAGGRRVASKLFTVSNK